ncbi:MAG: DUF4836 family protein [Prevotella sp.]|nr:DUF4836 family protein [Prevotella sp.]
MKPIFSAITILSLLAMMFSCSEEKNYEDAIPAECMAIVRIPSSVDNSRAKSMLSIFVGDERLADNGIDSSLPIYIFETPDGTISLCAKVSSSGEITDFLSSLQKEGKASEVKERRDVSYTLVNHNFLVAYNDDALLCTGPVLPASLQQQLSRFSRYLEMNADRGAGSGDMFSRLSDDGDVPSIIAKVSALPKQFVAPFLIGTPTGTSSSDILLHATAQCRDSVLILKGTTSSDNVLASQGIDRAMKMFRPISADDSTNDNTIVVLYANVKGDDFISLLEANKDLSQTLSGNSLREKLSAVDGNMLLSISPRSASLVSGDSSYDVDVKPLEEVENAGMRLKVVINVKRAGAEILSTIAPFLSGISSIEYIVE